MHRGFAQARVLVRVNKSVTAPIGPILRVVIEREPVPRLTALDVIPDLVPARHRREGLGVHDAVIRRPYHPCPQRGCEALCCAAVTEHPDPRRAQHDAHRWVWSQQGLKQRCMLEQRVALRCVQIGPFPGMPMHVFVMQNAVKIKIKDELPAASWTFHSLHPTGFMREVGPIRKHRSGPRRYWLLIEKYR
ncbi:hypothetical protein THIARS_40203 [Thiomonas delicata]|uniref:Uncharacterized protein n=1 Tax=Thiomonas delicata TaxID=364030 RepID=A0A238D016_THIDL|nr:hypothetical protein THIARS_40203 [Thiomonas delicata]